MKLWYLDRLVIIEYVINEMRDYKYVVYFRDSLPIIKDWLNNTAKYALHWLYDAYTYRLFLACLIKINWNDKYSVKNILYLPGITILILINMILWKNLTLSIRISRCQD